MNEYWLLVSFIILGLLALPIMLYPLGKSKALFLTAIPVFIIALSLAYWHWGAWPQWQNHVRQETSKQRIEAVLQTIKSPIELIDKLKQRLAQEPKSTRGWYLLGRLYASEGKWSEAEAAFSRAHQQSPDDELATVNYAQSLLQLNQQEFNQQIRNILLSLLQQKPNQPDALAMLAMDAFKNQDFLQAINYWQQLLNLAPEHSEEAQMIRKAIAKAEASQLKK
ncbi:MAG: tetratricopeptide repeat protein [Tatlockia sp.]|nr:tetratricopeptide repeat protein [Tatlockia sp.]